MLPANGRFCRSRSFQARSRSIPHGTRAACSSLNRAYYIQRPQFDDAEVDDRSKVDWFVMLIKVFPDLVVRGSNHRSGHQWLEWTRLDLFTLANVLCGSIMFIAWWHKSFDIRLPIVLDAPGPLPEMETVKWTEVFVIDTDTVGF